MNEIEKEEKEKLWYYSQLQGLSKRLDELPHVETVSSLGCPGVDRAPPMAGGIERRWRPLPLPGAPSPGPVRSSQQFSMQMDLIRQQLEFEAQHIRSLMEERFGTSDEMVQRAQVLRGRGSGRIRAQILWEESGLEGGVICLRANQRAEAPVGGACRRWQSHS